MSENLTPYFATQTWLGYYEDVSVCKNEGPVWNDLNVKAQAKNFSALLSIFGILAGLDTK